MSSSSPIKLGIIGLSAGGDGSWAEKSHLPYFKQSSSYKITALQNTSTASSKAAANKFDLPDVATHGDIDSLLTDDNIDMVLVSVKVPSHYALIKPAVQAGKHVFCEWPLARNLQEAEELAALAKQHNVRTMVGLQARQNPAIRKAKAMIDAGDLGDIVASTMTGTGGLFGPGLLTEYYAYTCDIENGANNLTIACAHAMDAMCFVLGELAYLQATLANHQPRVQIVDANGNPTRTIPKTSHDTMSITGRFQASAAVATVVYQGGMSPTGKHFYWEITGTKGSLVLENDVMGHIQMFQPVLKFVGSAAQGEGMQVVQVEDGSAMSYNVGRAWDLFAGGHEGVVSFEHAVVRHRMIDAIYKSEESGRRETYV